MMDKLEFSVRGIRPCEDSACGYYAEEDHGVVNLKLVNCEIRKAELFILHH